MKRVVLFKNGSDVDGKVIKVPDSFEDLISAASKKFGIRVERIFTVEGGEIDETDLIRDKEILYVSTGESFIQKKPFVKGELATQNIQEEINQLKLTVDKLQKELIDHQKFFGQLYCGEAAVTVRDALIKFEANEGLLEQFCIYSNLTKEDFNRLKMELSTLIKARNIVAHTGEKKIGNFSEEALQSFFEKLEYPLDSVFN